MIIQSAVVGSANRKLRGVPEWGERLGLAEQ
jgi:hypothetical protein